MRRSFVILAVCASCVSVPLVPDPAAGQGWWCFRDAENPAASSCERVLDTCRAWQVNGGGNRSQCVHERSAWCFSVIAEWMPENDCHPPGPCSPAPMKRVEERTCAPTPGACEARRSDRRAHRRAQEKRFSGCWADE